MSLTINIIHLTKNNAIYPMRANVDIMVFKELLVFENENEGKYYRNPYFYEGNEGRVEFVDGKVTIKADPNDITPRHMIEEESLASQMLVDDGIRAKLWIADIHPKREGFQAIIPKGTKFYIGSDGDIIAEEMIVYEDKSQLPVESMLKTPLASMIESVMWPIRTKHSKFISGEGYTVERIVKDEEVTFLEKSYRENEGEEVIDIEFGRNFRLI